MGYCLSREGIDQLLQYWQNGGYTVFAPKRFAGGGAFSDTDYIRYGAVRAIDEIVFDVKSDYSFKEWLLPVTQFLFYFTEDQIKEAAEQPRKAVIFLRSCDLHGVKRLDGIYLHNGVPDYYYKQIRDQVKFVLMGCVKAWENCFCVDMDANRTHCYDLSIDSDGDQYLIDCKEEAWQPWLLELAIRELAVVPRFVTETAVHVAVPSGLSAKVAASSMWAEYDSRCINCGRCNFVCPTCTCFTMQDVFYTDNRIAGERRRVWASCMVDGYTDVAGGGSYRKKTVSACALKRCTKFWTSSSILAATCVWDAGVVTTPVRNTFLSAVLLIAWMRRCGRLTMLTNEYAPFNSKIKQVIKHTDLEYTFKMTYAGPVKPGQFFEVSLPKYGEAPISVSGIGENTVDLTIRKVGRVTGEVFERYAGQSLFMRGPYGNGFDLDLYKGKELVVIAGGTGVSPVRGVVDYFSRNMHELKGLTVVAGFKSPGDILFRDDFSDWENACSVVLTVDKAGGNVSCREGLVTEYIPTLDLRDASTAMAIVVGPPAMMRFTVKGLLETGFREANIWISQERKMCCGIGKCGHCKINDIYVCLDGPVFNYTKGKTLLD